MIDKIVDSIYPPICGFCGKVGPHDLCKKCEINLLAQAEDKIDIYEDKYYNSHFYLFEYKRNDTKKVN